MRSVRGCLAVTVVSAVLALGCTDLLVSSAYAATRPLETPSGLTEQAGAGLTPTIELVVDTSGSMNDEDSQGRNKLEGAKSAILNFIAGLPRNTDIGMRTYPASTSGGCDSGQVAFKIENRAPADMDASVRSLQADGDTPTAQALQAAANDMRASGSTHGVLVLISDGLATCGNPCPAAQKIAASGLDLEVISVGFAISGPGRRELECIADATHGAYLDARDSAGLRSTLGALTSPSLSMTLHYPPEVVADVGVGPEGLVTITADIANTGQLDAADVVGWLRFTGNSLGNGASPGVGGPTHALGNVAAGGMVSTHWQFEPGLILAGATLRFEVIVLAQNLPEEIVTSGSIRIVDATRRSDAGPVFKDARRIAILGDSYSAGEGSGDYLAGTDTDNDACHRSRHTTMVDEFNIPDDLIIACSGAVASYITGPNGENHEPAQADVLADAERGSEGRVDAVVMTLGGNNVGFATLASTCILDTHKLIHIDWHGVHFDPGHCNASVDGQPAQQWEDAEFAGLGDKDHPYSVLIKAWQRISETINSPGYVAARGRLAPIIAPAYPRIVPGSDRSCGINGIFFTQDELVFVDHFITRLNGAIESATKEARAEGIPVYFAPTTEDAFLPDHTICDDPAYANGLQRGVDLGIWSHSDLSAALRGNTIPALRSFLHAANRAKNQIFHPDTLGYRALTSALIRWSLTPDGEAAGDSHLTGGDFDQDSVASVLGNGDGQVTGAVSPGESVSVAAGSRVSVQAGGFAPNSTVSISAASTPMTVGYLEADSHGVVSGDVTLPGNAVLQPGTHHLIVDGYNFRTGTRRLVIAFQVKGRGFPVLITATAAFPALLVIVGAVLLWTDRRRKQRHRTRPQIHPSQ